MYTLYYNIYIYILYIYVMYTHIYIYKLSKQYNVYVCLLSVYSGSSRWIWAANFGFQMVETRDMQSRSVLKFQPYGTTDLGMGQNLLVSILMG